MPLVKPNVSKTKFHLECKLLKSARYFFILCQIGCAAPAGIHLPLHSTKGSFWQRCQFVLHFLWSVLVCATVVYFSQDQFLQVDHSKTGIQQALFALEHVLNCIQAILTAFFVVANQAKIVRLIYAMVDIDFKLLSMGLPSDYRFGVKFATKHVGLLVLLVTVVITLNFTHQELTVVTVIRSFICYTVPNLMNALNLCLYYSLLKYSEEKANQINSILVQLHEDQTRFARFVKLNKRIAGPIDKAKHMEVATLLNSMRLIYTHLEKFIKDVNETFAVIILATFVGSFLGLSSAIFGIYQYVRGEEKVNTTAILFHLVWMFLHCGKLFCVLYYNNCIVTEKEYSTLILNEINSNNRRLEVSLNRFLLQLSMDNRVFVICGVIELDMLLIKSILMNLSMYVVFLIQYDLTLATFSTFKPVSSS